MEIANYFLTIFRRKKIFFKKSVDKYKKMLYNFFVMKKNTLNFKNFDNALVLKSAGVSFISLSIIGMFMFNMFIKLIPITARP